MVILEPDGSMTTHPIRLASEVPVESVGSEIAEVVMQHVAQRLGEIESTMLARIEELRTPCLMNPHGL